MSSEDLALLEKLFSPSQWSHRLPASEIVDEHVRLTSQLSAEVKTTIPCQLDVEVRPGEGHLMDIFGDEALPTGSPWLVFVHGGYWQMLSKDCSCYCAGPLFRAGVRLVVPGYDIAPKGKLSSMEEQIRLCAEATLRVAASLKSRVWFAGHSAGAQLVATLLTSGWIASLPEALRGAAAGLLLVSGVYDLRPLVATSVNAALGLSDAAAAAHSPLLGDARLPGADFAVLVAVAEHDSPAFQAQARDFVEMLQEARLPVELFVVPEADHFDVVENLSKDDFTLTRKIIDLIKAKEHDK